MGGEGVWEARAGKGEAWGMWGWDFTQGVIGVGAWPRVGGGVGVCARWVVGDAVDGEGWEGGNLVFALLRAIDRIKTRSIINPPNGGAQSKRRNKSLDN